MSKLLDYFDLNKRSKKKFSNINSNQEAKHFEGSKEDIHQSIETAVINQKPEELLIFDKNLKRLIFVSPDDPRLSDIIDAPVPFGTDEPKRFGGNEEDIRKVELETNEKQTPGINYNEEDKQKWMEAIATNQKQKKILIFDKDLKKLIPISPDDPRLSNIDEPVLFGTEEPKRFGGNEEDNHHNEVPTTKTISLWKQIAMYLGILIGVVFSSSILQATQNTFYSLNIAISTILLSAIIAFAIMPNVYEKAMKPEAPFLVQFGLFVQNGVFWSLLLGTISKKL